MLASVALCTFRFVVVVGGGGREGVQPLDAVPLEHCQWTATVAAKKVGQGKVQRASPKRSDPSPLHCGPSARFSPISPLPPLRLSGRQLASQANLGHFPETRCSIIRFSILSGDLPAAAGSTSLGMKASTIHDATVGGKPAGQDPTLLLQSSCMKEQFHSISFMFHLSKSHPLSFPLPSYSSPIAPSGVYSSYFFCATSVTRT
jgi:hypothetical protein